MPTVKWKNILKGIAEMTDVTEKTIWDIAIVGAGAAGLMAAITSARAGSRVLILDGREKIGAKILMSGGTRCNVTNQTVTEKDYESEQGKIVRSVLAAFRPEQARNFFEELGVELILEPNGKYFPSTHSGRTILEALVKEMDRSGAVLESGQKITGIAFHNEVFELTAGSGRVFRARAVILATGGLSFPSTGSDGTGYELAKKFGHSLIPTSPSLTPLRGNDAGLQSLSGVALPVRLTVRREGKKIYEFEGDFLFTHQGYSGPAALNVSRHWIRSGGKAEILVSFAPSFNEDELRGAIESEIAESPKMTLKRFLSMELPVSLVEVLMRRLDFPEDLILNQVSREQKNKLIRSLLYFPLPVTGDLGYAKAEVTAGGVDFSEVERLTLQSKLQKGLFFAGEILDVDGRIGGFNFQWAWASGFVSGNAARNYSKGAKTDV